MRLRQRRTHLTAVLLLAGRTAFPQSGPDDQARRLLEDGRAYRLEGKVKQALDNFNTIVSGFASTDSVDDALLEIGRHHADAGDLAKAREAFDQVVKRYPQSDGAPGAYHSLGMLALRSATAPAELDDALAQFTRVVRLYPQSEWVPRAIHASGLVHRRAGRLGEAVDAHRRVALEYPTSDVAAEAQFQVGHALALSGESLQAMEAFQAVRNRHGATGEWAGRALERTTALYRLYGRPAPAFALDTAFTVGAGEVLKDVRALLAVPDGTVWIASEKTRSVVPFAKGGAMGGSVSADEPRALALSPAGEVLVTTRGAVRFGTRDLKTFSVPSDKPGVNEPLERITAATVTQGGSVLVADDKKKRVYRFDGNAEFRGLFVDRDREVARLLTDGEGGVVLLDRAERAVTVYDEAGKVLRAVPARGTGYEMRKPVDVAVDPFRNLYVADEEGGVFVFGPTGALLVKVGGEEMRRPRALTLDPTGALLVYDDRAQKVLRYR